MERSLITLFLLIFLSVCLNVVAQLLLKIGMTKIGHFDFTLANLWPIGWKVATNLPIVIGLTIYVASVTIWLMVLSRSDVSFAYPLSSLGYVLTAIAAAMLLGEQVTVLRMAGILFIVLGVFLVARTA